MRKFTQAILASVCLLCGTALGDISVPLPPGDNFNATAYRAFAEVFLDVTDSQNPMGLPKGVYNHVGIGYTRDANGDSVPGDNAFVAYTGALSSTAANPTPPGKILLIDPTGDTISQMFSGMGDWTDKSRGRLFIGGVILGIDGKDLATGQSQGMVDYNLGGSDPDPDPQITFAVYNGYVQHMAIAPIHIDAVSSGGQMLVRFTLGGENPLHLDFYADETPDAMAGAPVGGRRYGSVPGTIGTTPELPLRDDDPAGTLLVGLNDGTYYDRNASGWGDMAWTGSPADDDEVMWSFVGNPDSDFHMMGDFYTGPDNEVFLMTWDAGTPGDPSDDIITPVHTSGRGNLTHFSFDGQFIPGTSLAPAGKLTADGKGFLNYLLMDGQPYPLSGHFLFGGDRIGAYDSDPNTWSLEQEPLGTVSLTQFSGPLVPEPMTLSILTAGMALVVLRRRRTRPKG